MSHCYITPEAKHCLALSEAYRFLTEACLGQGKLDEALVAARESLWRANKEVNWKLAIFLNS